MRYGKEGLFTLIAVQVPAAESHDQRLVVFKRASTEILRARQRFSARVLLGRASDRPNTADNGRCLMVFRSRLWPIGKLAKQNSRRKRWRARRISVEALLNTTRR